MRCAAWLVSGRFFIFGCLFSPSADTHRGGCTAVRAGAGRGVDSAAYQPSREQGGQAANQAARVPARQARASLGSPGHAARRAPAAVPEPPAVSAAGDRAAGAAARGVGLKQPPVMDRMQAPMDNEPVGRRVTRGPAAKPRCHDVSELFTFAHMDAEIQSADLYAANACGSQAVVSYMHSSPAAPFTSVHAIAPFQADAAPGLPSGVLNARARVGR